MPSLYAAEASAQLQKNLRKKVPDTPNPAPQPLHETHSPMLCSLHQPQAQGDG